MPRKRIIDPQFWNDEEIGAWSVEARLFYIGLWNFADDEGRLRAHPKLLKAQIFPYDKRINIEKLKTEVSNKVLWYRVDGQEYGYIKNFLKHQRIDRPSKSQLPAPDKDILEKFLKNGTLNEDSRNIQRAFGECSPNIQRGLAPNRIEEKLIEDNIKRVSNDTLSSAEPTSAHQKNKDNFKEWCQTIVSQWNEFALKTGLPAVKAITSGSKRERLLRARFNEKEFNFPKILEKVARSDFLLGVKTDWKVSFDWLICPSNYIKVLEGNYDNNIPQKDSVKASRVGENKVKTEYPPGYWEKVRELRQKGLQGEAIREELMKIPEFYSFFRKQQGGQNE